MIIFKYGFGEIQLTIKQLNDARLEVQQINEDIVSKNKEKESLNEKAIEMHIESNKVEMNTLEKELKEQGRLCVDKGHDVVISFWGSSRCSCGASLTSMSYSRCEKLHREREKYHQLINKRNFLKTPPFNEDFIKEPLMTLEQYIETKYT